MDAGPIRAVKPGVVEIVVEGGPRLVEDHPPLHPPVNFVTSLERDRIPVGAVHADPVDRAVTVYKKERLLVDELDIVGIGVSLSEAFEFLTVESDAEEICFVLGLADEEDFFAVGTHNHRIFITVEGRQFDRASPKSIKLDHRFGQIGRIRLIFFVAFIG